MNRQRLGMRRFLPTARRRWMVIDAVAMLGLLAGAGYAALSPPTLTSTALVVLSPVAQHSPGQGSVATSAPVLAGALGTVDPGKSPAMLRGAVQAKSLTPTVLSISAQGLTAVQAERTANAVASSYVRYVNSPHGFGGPIRARILQPAMNATGTPLPHRLNRHLTAGSPRAGGLSILVVPVRR
jgi:Chain length determinant protein